MRTTKRQFKGDNPVPPGVPVLAFGTCLINKEAVRLRGLPVGRSTMVLKHLEERQACGLLLTVRTDEYKASKSCILACFSQNLSMPQSKS
ncbi:hypothetical protein BC940DRAFT_286992 [Gongronella butleri]|nr:hypothetical protein BC940DRAFT_286992 [Gongronella butleri]